MGLTYTPATLEDVDVIFDQCRSLIESYEDLTVVDFPKVLSWVRKKIESQISDYTCVRFDSQKVAYFHLSEEPENTELDDFYVLSEYRNRGIGTQILKHCTDHMSKPIYLYVFARNMGAIRLYERFGFIKARQVSPTRFIMMKQP